MIAWRIKVFFLRLFDYLLGLPIRFFHLLLWLFWITPLRGKNCFLRWISGLILLVMDLSAATLFYETILDWIKWKTRPLNDREKEIGRFVFGKNIPFHLMGIDPGSIPAIKKKTVAYVSFHTINFDTEIPDPILVHEMMHIWQYGQIGAAYISEAFWAQKWGGGYNYGGLEPLKMHSEGLRLKAFNFEQQADIIEDYYRWTQHIPLQWAANDPESGKVLVKYAKQIQS